MSSKKSFLESRRFADVVSFGRQAKLLTRAYTARVSEITLTSMPLWVCITVYEQ
jgi:hypothetical protein